MPLPDERDSQGGTGNGRERRHRRRRSRPRSRTIARKRLTREELRVGALLYPPVDTSGRPLTRGECSDGPRPCPWVSCRHHLYLDADPKTGSIKINFPDLEPWDLSDTCALDVADRGGITLEEVGEAMNLTRERIRQVEVKALHFAKLMSPSEAELGARPPPEKPRHGNTGRKIAQRGPRTCSVCEDTGHDRRTCPMRDE